MIANTHYGYVGKSKAPKFTYTGNYKVRDDGVVELLTSGTIVFLEPKVIDVFMVGGGAGGGNLKGAGGGNSTGGGGGGYTRTIRRVNITSNASLQVIVGAGGSLQAIGGASSFGSDYTVEGGKTVNGIVNGGAGGSGGGGAVVSNSDYGSGGYDGNNGESGYVSGGATGGVGQGFTTREFGEVTGKLYAGGGGGGRYIAGGTFVTSQGGSGGGGSGACGHNSDAQPAAAGVANTGGGGGGAATSGNGVLGNGGTGGSGIVCFRESVELPELAGTWRFNEVIYRPLGQGVSYPGEVTAKQTVDGYDYSYPKGILARGTEWTHDPGVFLVKSGTTTGKNKIYTFNSNLEKVGYWSIDYPYKYITFPAGASASDEFMVWLASNATKQ